ncbi:hypothetical protein M0802_006615 [Mischocyttarus mexicanus]|nr:hypothetical protein M0802_006615 [Mischocyttarus mexicanus]
MVVMVVMVVVQGNAGRLPRSFTASSRSLTPDTCPNRILGTVGSVGTVRTVVTVVTVRILGIIETVRTVGTKNKIQT